jgi:arylsulfatase A-like enzyme
MTDYLSNNAIKIIEVNKNSSTPFFITLAYNAPHNPFQSLLSDYNSPEFENISDHHEKVYYGMIKCLDRGIGKIIDSLKKTNQFNNTMIIFTSDNGGAHYSNVKNTNKPYKGFKSTYFEGGIKVPLFIQFPKIISKKSINYKLSHHVDIFNTIKSIIHNLSFKKNNNKKYEKINLNDGINLFDIKKKHKTLFWRSGKYLCLRYYHWKISFSERPNKIWLYDLRLDPTENKNLLEKINIQKNIINAKYSNINYINYNNCSIEHFANNLFKLLIKYNNTAKTPLWNSVIEIPIPINNNLIKDKKDEYVYWSN